MFGVNRQTLERLRKEYPEGTRVELIRLDDPYRKIPSGTTGTVEYVDDAGQLHTVWNGHGSLAMIYGNGDWYVDYGYDALSRLTRQSYNGVTAFEWGYNNKGQTAWEKDHANGRETRYGYDTLGRMSEWWNTSGARGSYRYDENNSLLKWRYGAFGLTAEQENTYRRNLLTKSTVGGVTVNYTYDALTRVSEKKVGVQRTTYDYLPVMTSSINQTTTRLCFSV